jgi:hypothetical protein
MDPVVAEEEGLESLSKGLRTRTHEIIRDEDELSIE